MGQISKQEIYDLALEILERAEYLDEKLSDILLILKDLNRECASCRPTEISPPLVPLA